MNTKIYLTISLITFVASFTQAQTYSELWGKDGELWTDATKKHLRDFSGVGYMKGEVPLPDWPVGVTVTDYGAIPNDDIDDSAAFMKAIADCPEHHAVFVPNGTWIMKQQIVASRDNVVVRGEDMYDTVIYMPEYTSVLPGADQYTKWYVLKGMNSGLENFTFKLKEASKVSHWDGMKGGAHAIMVNATNSWVRNILILNGDNAFTIHGGSHNTVVNIVLDNYLGRASPKGYVGHFGIGMKDTEKNLAHNIKINGRWHHALCTLGTADDNVWSQARMQNGEIDHHSAGGQRQLYTDIDAGDGYVLFEQDMSVHKTETYWNLKSKRKDWPYGYNRGEIVTEGRQATIVAMQTSDPSDADLANDYWFETIDPKQIHPENIYLAQMAKAGKPLPNYPMPEPPSADGPLIIEPIADSTVQGGSSSGKNDGRSKLIVKLASNDNATREVFMKFDLSGIAASEIGTAKLRLYTQKGGPQTLMIQSVADDSWTEQEITWNTKPAASPENAVSAMVEPEKWTEFDLTSYAQQQATGDKLLSIKLISPEKGGSLVLSSREGGFKPHLVIN